MTDFEQKALEYVRMMQENRNNAAKRIMENRRFVRQVLEGNEHIGPELRLKLLHSYASIVDKDWRHMMKPSPANLLRAAKALLAYSRTTWENPYDTEYYSA